MLRHTRALCLALPEQSSQHKPLVSSDLLDAPELHIDALAVTLHSGFYSYKPKDFTNQISVRAQQPQQRTFLKAETATWQLIPCTAAFLAAAVLLLRLPKDRHVPSHV